MEIQANKAYGAIHLIARQPFQRESQINPKDVSPITSNSAGDKVIISKEARELAAQESQIHNAENFRDISPSDMLGAVNRLIKSGQMSLDESSSIISLIPISLRGEEESFFNNQKMDFIFALENLISFNQSIHNEDAVIYGNKALNALERFQKSS